MSELCELFNIGQIYLGISPSEDSLLLGLESLTWQRTISKDGISLPQEDCKIELVKPGGYDQNFPSNRIARAFFDVLAASLTFNLGESPVCVTNLQYPGTEIIYDAKGNRWNTTSEEVLEAYLFLGYGEANYKEHVEKIIGKKILPLKERVWGIDDDIPDEFEEALWWRAHKLKDYKSLDKSILGIDDRPQLIVLTGFLGSGKTSFLQHFIEYQVQLNRFVAIIQNEIGEVGLDGKLLDHDYAVTEIDEGCVCCTLVGNLKNAIHQILSSFHPDYIILETTGLANPYNLLDELSEVDELVRFDSITTMVDGLNVDKSLKEYDVAREQIKAADILLLNKKDQLTALQLDQIKQKIRTLNPSAPIMTTADGDVNPALIYGVDLQENPEAVNRKAHQKTGNQTHHSHAHDSLSSYKITFHDPLDRIQFLEAIKNLPCNIFRIKGIVDFKESLKPLVFQYVGGRFEFSEFNNPNLPDRFLILIGQDLQEDSIALAFNCCLL